MGQLCCGIIGREAAARFVVLRKEEGQKTIPLDLFPRNAVQAFNRVGGMDASAQRWRGGEERAFPAPFGLEIIKGFGGVLVVHGLAILPAAKDHAMAQEMDGAALHLCSRKRCIDSFGEAFEAVPDRDQDALDSQDCANCSSPKARIWRLRGWRATAPEPSNKETEVVLLFWPGFRLS